jgi:hypothetical protein
MEEGFGPVYSGGDTLSALDGASQLRLNPTGGSLPSAECRHSWLWTFRSSTQILAWASAGHETRPGCLAGNPPRAGASLLAQASRGAADPTPYLRLPAASGFERSIL